MVRIPRFHCQGPGFNPLSGAGTPLTYLLTGSQPETQKGGGKIIFLPYNWKTYLKTEQLNNE